MDVTMHKKRAMKEGSERKSQYGCQTTDTVTAELSAAVHDWDCRGKDAPHMCLQVEQDAVLRWKR